MMFFGGSMIIWHFTSLVDWDQPDEVIPSGNPTWFLDNSPFIDHFPIEMPISDGIDELARMKCPFNPIAAWASIPICNASTLHTPQKMDV